jgi:hypothetical protein
VSFTNAQELSSHQWKDRLVIVLTKYHSQDIFKKQISELANHLTGLENRRIVVYQSLPDKYIEGLMTEGKWTDSDDIYNNYKVSDTDYELVLIGLVGEIKLRENKLLTCEELFAMIDRMPMRKAQMNRRQND